MQRKTFISRLFKRKINSDDLAYWDYLYAEILYRIKQIEDLNCPCGDCFSDKAKTKHLSEKIIIDDHVPENKRPTNFTGIGDCGRRLPPRA